ncbi:MULTISPECIES: VOC family protein [unclassified Arsukibacterium]|uniref:VOC family protein n=1 Tax=unclassified Arsukibacterium TaxID=2635278 RepID=UPI000C90E435|nr:MULTISPECIES: VOC family protein [unclassified Arsukibacterium]MAA96532.1 glyoxalase [Rheinheimera sp.]HAW94231.1 glyoxalase [Candidatus Azambacteria bacterium]|tara:strand:- start:619 stop:1083 length:465 start_codon:yes stop_codon:yes gene_type:complete
MSERKPQVQSEVQSEVHTAPAQDKPVLQNIGNIALLVADYDDAIAFYTTKLQFNLVADTDLGGGKRWVEIAPPNSNGSHILLAKASNEQQQVAVGNQTGGRVFLFLHTNDFWRDYHAMQGKGVVFNEQPRAESYGTVAVFQDLYGNKWDLLQLN